MQNNHQLTTPKQTSLTLWRFPKQPIDSPLQAWDSADNLIVSQFIEQYPDANTIAGKLAIINDQFGAITCQLAQYHPCVYQDSKVSRLATEANLALNELTSGQIQFDNHLNAINEKLVILIKIPKNLDYLEGILAHIHQFSPSNVQVMASAKANSINKSVLKLFNRYFNQVDSSLAVRKSRVISASGKQKSPYSSFKAWLTWPKFNDLILTNAANVFSRSSLDIGAEFLIQHLPDATDKKVIDLACGNGVLGLSLIKQYPIQSITFSDDSFQAIESSQHNWQSNFPDSQVKSQFVWQDCLSETHNESIDLIICNPPFHQQQTITDHIATQMFQDAYRTLTIGGELRIVGNRHLGYHKKLESIFGQYSIVATNEKFVIISATKQN